MLKRSNSSDSWESSFTITSSDSWSPPNSSNDATVSLHPTLDGDGLLVKVDTPRTPRGGIDGHVPCDIVLVVDVSGSMGCNAPVPGGGSEDYGLSVLDLNVSTPQLRVSHLRTIPQPKSIPRPKALLVQ